MEALSVYVLFTYQWASISCRSINYFVSHRCTHQHIGSSQRSTYKHTGHFYCRVALLCRDSQYQEGYRDTNPPWTLLDTPVSVDAMDSFWKLLLDELAPTCPDGVLCCERMELGGHFWYPVAVRFTRRKIPAFQEEQKTTFGTTLLATGFYPTLSLSTTKLPANHGFCCKLTPK